MVAFAIACGREEEDERRNLEGWSEAFGEAERRGKDEGDDPSSEIPKQRSKAVRSETESILYARDLRRKD